MIEFPRFSTAIAAVVILLVGVPAPGQDAKPGTPYRGVVGPQIPSLPGYWQLGMENVQKELELVPEQIEKLKALGKKYYEQMRADQGQWQDWSKMTPEERSAKYKEITEKQKERAEAARKEVEKILLPHQLELLQNISFRSVAPSMLSQPRVMESIGLTQDQKDRIQKVRAEMMEKYQQLQKESTDKIFQVLTAEQKEKLKTQLRQRGY